MPVKKSPPKASKAVPELFATAADIPFVDPLPNQADHEQIAYPSSKLSAVTRKKNQIDELKSSKNQENLLLVKKYLSEYEEKKKVFEEACALEELKKGCTKYEEFISWKNNHKEEMDKFYSETKDWLGEGCWDDTVAPHDSVSCAGKSTRSSSRSSVRSSTSSVRARIAQKKVECEAKLKLLEETSALRQKEIDTRLEYERKMLALKLETERLTLKNEDEALSKIVEKLEDIDGNQSNVEPPATGNAKDFNVSDIGKFLAKQNDITELLVKNQSLSQLPCKEPDFFDGEDILSYRTFVLSFERCINEKCNEREKYYYLLKYTKGDAHKLVMSCQGSDDKTNYHEARKLLHKTYGNEYVIAGKYLEKLHSWPEIRSEDPTSLTAFARFLTTCLNLMDQMKPLNQLNRRRDINY